MYKMGYKDKDLSFLHRCWRFSCVGIWRSTGKYLWAFRRNLL